jgi:hypothetical protein
MQERAAIDKLIGSVEEFLGGSHDPNVVIAVLLRSAAQICVSAGLTKDTWSLITQSIYEREQLAEGGDPIVEHALTKTPVES